MSEEIPTLRRSPRGLKRVGGVWGESFAEFLGTFVLILFGDGSVAMAVAGLPGSGRAETPTSIFLAAGDWLLIAFGWAFAVMLGVYIAGGISGAHINPAVTVAFAVRRRFPWRKVGPYVAAQVLGAFAGAAVIYAVYQSAINAFDVATQIPKSSGEALATFSIFATFPAAYFHGSWVGPFIDQVVGTALLLMGIAALIDRRNVAPLSNLAPLITGLLVGAIGISFGANAGYAINPARDFGPRFFAWIAGWGEVALPGTIPGAFSWYFWIPIVGPLVGGVIGVLVYDFFIGDALAARAEPQPPGRAGPGAEEPVDATGADVSAVDARRETTGSESPGGRELSGDER
ncbi:MIP/aquaporin family protein [Actinopolymorpha alba]|uniref:MIP/aquaporin family protein n=1 Tax=Actinopolymorpha alba TaxID=533267 RepID=UPI00036C18C6|nr:MIP/aquaporin family protein [Actinopolymorpha alba]